MDTRRVLKDGTCKIGNFWISEHYYLAMSPCSQCPRFMRKVDVMGIISHPNPNQKVNDSKNSREPPPAQ